jgi:ACS family hexuronate transporter-like MFS transporter
MTFYLGNEQASKSVTSSFFSEDRATFPLASARWRWGLCWLMFVSTALTYMDRQAISVVGESIKREFRVDNQGFGWVMSAFFLTYALFQVPAGYLADRCNVRWLYALAVTWWSIAAAALAFAPTLGVLMIFRGLLGVGESFNWPCALRATSAVLPPGDRGLGNGIFNSGAAVGAVLTPLVVTRLVAWYGWRPTFVVIASLGWVWVGIWLFAVRGVRGTILAGRPSSRLPTDRLSRRAILAYGSLVVVSIGVSGSSWWVGVSGIWWAIASLMFGMLLVARLLPRADSSGADWSEALGEVVRLRRFWVLVLTSISINICWNFLINWLPGYLKQDRGMSFLVSGMWAALPFLAADVGNFGGGAVSRFLAVRGLTPWVARLRVMAVCSLLIGSGGLVGWIEDDRVAIGLLGLMALGTAGFMANYFAFCQEVSARHTGFIVGVLGGLGNLFVASFLPFAGYVKDKTGSFGLIFVLAGLLPFVGLGALVVGWRADRPENPSDPATRFG